MPGFLIAFKTQNRGSSHELPQWLVLFNRHRRSNYELVQICQRTLLKRNVVKYYRCNFICLVGA